MDIVNGVAGLSISQGTPLVCQIMTFRLFADFLNELKVAIFKTNA
jgi:hypothetical protein